MKTIKEAKFGKAVVRLLQTSTGYKAVTINGGKVASTEEGMEAEAVWKQAISKVGQTGQGFWGYEDALNRFAANFPNGFLDALYIEKERAYKEAAAAFIAENIPIEAARSPTPALCECANKAFGKTNMATPIEKTRVQALLRSPKGVNYLSALVELAEGDTNKAFSKLDGLMREHGQPSWPCATYLPFFWQSTSTMFLKPQVTRDFAERVGHSFVNDYDARLNAHTYASLLDLATECERKIVSLTPRDRIDTQSFIWVVGAYPAPAFD